MIWSSGIFNRWCFLFIEQLKRLTQFRWGFSYGGLRPGSIESFRSFRVGLVNHCYCWAVNFAVFYLVRCFRKSLLRSFSWGFSLGLESLLLRKSAFWGLFSGGNARAVFLRIKRIARFIGFVLNWDLRNWCF